LACFWRWRVNALDSVEENGCARTAVGCSSSWAECAPEHPSGRTARDDFSNLSFCLLHLLSPVPGSRLLRRDSLLPELISGLSEGFFAQTDFGDVGSQPTRYCGPFFSAADDRSRPHDQLQGAFAPSGHPNPFFSAGSAGRRRGDAVAFAAIDPVRPGAAGLAHRVYKARKLLPLSRRPRRGRRGWHLHPRDGWGLLRRLDDACVVRGRYQAGAVDRRRRVQARGRTDGR